MLNKFLLLTAFVTASFAFTTNLGSTANSSEKEEVAVEETSEITKKALTADEEINILYKAFSENNTSVPSLVSFKNALTGYAKLVEEGKIKKELLTIVDFSLSSDNKRMWILDMATNEVLYHTYVAHGRNTGGKMATKFSNKSNSFQSSLGFYVTAETYHGKNGLSLFIDGMEKGINNNARNRYVVMHGAAYANPDFIQKTGRLGRSLGCPAIPQALTKEVIELIKGESALFIYHPNKDYAKNSKYINQAV
jgi:hypothetical protein